MASRLFSLAARTARSRASSSSSPSQSPLLPSVSHALPTKATALALTDDRFTRYNSPIPVTVDHTPVLSVPPTRVTTLSNGLRVASESNPTAGTASVGVWIDAGSRFESDSTNGTAHFLEHMLFKGTTSRSVSQLEVEIENMGGHLNAYTSRETTAYFAKVMKKDVGSAVNIIGDILQNSKFSESAIENERNVILREASEVEKVTREVLFDHLHATAFQYSPLGRTILGPEENIKKITRDDLSSYIKTHYTGPRMVIAAAGAVDHDELVKLAEKNFGSLSSDPTTSTDLVKKNPSIFTGSEVRIRDDDLPLCHLAIAFKGCGWTDADSIPLMVMQTMLGAYDRNGGGGTALGSELAQKIAANDLAESFSAFNTNYSDVGLFGIFAAAPPGKLDDLAWSIMHETTRMIYRVSEDDVIRARNQLKSSILLHLDGTSAVAEDIGRQLLTYGRRIPTAELLARIDAVDVETVKRVADRFIFDKDIAVSAIGPTQFLPDYNWLRRRTYWLRY